MRLISGLMIVAGVVLCATGVGAALGHNKKYV